MKKILTLVIFLFFVYEIKSQDLFVYSEAQTTQPMRELSDNNLKDHHYNWIWIALSGKNGNGVFIQASDEPETKTFALGYMLSKTFSPNGFYAESGIASGLEWNKGQSRNPVSGSAYIYMENKSDERRAKNKFVLLFYSYYSETFGFWHQGYAMYSPIKIIGIGGFYQTDSAFGPRVQINIPGGFTPWIAIDLKNQSSRLATLGFMWNGTIHFKKADKK